MSENNLLEIPEKINQVIQEFIKSVHEILGDRVKKIILYGSYARGDYRENSDIDIMILTDLSDEEMEEYRTKIVDCAYDLEYDNHFSFDLSPVIKNIDTFNYWLDTLPFYMNVQKEGVILSES